MAKKNGRPGRGESAPGRVAVLTYWSLVAKREPVRIGVCTLAEVLGWHSKPPNARARFDWPGHVSGQTRAPPPLSHSTNCPSCREMDAPEIQPKSGTRDFWKEWGSLKPDATSIAEAIETLPIHVMWNCTNRWTLNVLLDGILESFQGRLVLSAGNSKILRMFEFALDLARRCLYRWSWGTWRRSPRWIVVRIVSCLRSILRNSLSGGVCSAWGNKAPRRAFRSISLATPQCVSTYLYRSPTKFPPGDIFPRRMISLNSA